MGVILGAHVSDLEAIRLAGLSATKSEHKVLQAWLSNCENPTWQRLVDAVGHRAGGNHQRLAKSLSKELDKNDAGNTDNLHYKSHMILVILTWFHILYCQG